MSTPQTPEPAPTEPPPPVIVEPQTDSRLDALAAEYARLKPQVDELTERLEAVKTAMKTGTRELCPPGTTNAILRSPHLPFPMQVHRVTSWRFDTKSLKRDDPKTYAQWQMESTSWRMDPVK